MLELSSSALLALLVMMALERPEVFGAEVARRELPLDISERLLVSLLSVSKLCSSSPSESCRRATPDAAVAKAEKGLPLERLLLALGQSNPSPKSSSSSSIGFEAAEPPLDGTAERTCGGLAVAVVLLFSRLNGVASPSEPKQSSKSSPSSSATAAE